MEKKTFTYIKRASLSDVLDIALDSDETSRTKSYEFCKKTHKVWILRQLKSNQNFQHIECFEFKFSKEKGWGFLGWSEDEGIPHFDCPILYLASTAEIISLEWRQQVFGYQGERYSIPRGAWLHSTSGVRLPNNEVKTDFQFVGTDVFCCTGGKEWRLPPKVAARLVQEGFGISLGRA